MQYKIIDKRNGRVLAICPSQSRLDFKLKRWARYRRFLEVVEESSTPSS